MPDTILKHVPGMRDAAPVAVEYAETLHEKVFAETYVANSRPCLIKNAVAHWPGAQKWRSGDYLKSRCGHHDILYFPHENHITFQRMMAGKQNMPLREAIDHLHSEETEVATLGLPEDLPELRADLGRFSFLTKAEPSFLYPSVRYFIYRNAGSTWHYHPLDETLMCQFVGSKRVGLLQVDNPSHKGLKDIFLGEKYYEDAGIFDSYDSTQLPFLSAILEEGDALYIPPLWWHGVVTASVSFGMTAAIPFRSPPHVIASALKKMAAGEVELLGATSAAQSGALAAVAQKLGLERELALASNRAGKM